MNIDCDVCGGNHFTNQHPKRKITFVFGEAEWDGMYIDGKMVHQDHSLRLFEVLKALGIQYETRDVDQEWLDNRGHLPDNLEDCQFTT